MAAGRKTGGRTAGTPNRATAARQQEVADSGLTPLDFMLKRMRNTKLDDEARFEAAKAAAPYVHPKLSTVQMEATVHADVADEPEPMTKDQWQTETSRFVQ